MKHIGIENSFEFALEFEQWCNVKLGAIIKYPVELQLTYACTFLRNFGV